MGLFLFGLLSSCSSLFYYPDSFFHYPPSRFSLRPSEFKVNTSDGEVLDVWVFSPSQQKKGTVIQFHGNGENMSSHYLNLIFLIHAGYELITFDYRGYGRSTGSPTHAGTAQDAEAMLAFALSRKENKPLIVIGQSLGGAIGLSAVARFKEQSQIDLFVVDSSFVSYKEIARRKLGSSPFTWAFSWIPFLFVSDEFAPIRIIHQYSTKTLLIHDPLDPVVPFACTHALAESLKGQLIGEWVSENPMKIPTHLGSLNRLPLQEELVKILSKL